MNHVAGVPFTHYEDIKESNDDDYYTDDADEEISDKKTDDKSDTDDYKDEEEQNNKMKMTTIAMKMRTVTVKTTKMKRKNNGAATPFSSNLMNLATNNIRSPWSSTTMLLSLLVAVALLVLPSAVVATQRQCRLASKKKDRTRECLRPNNKLGQARLPVCAGVRGNGPRLFAHFPALARAVEALGPIAAIAGGSSASVTVFLVESIESNPYVLNCGDRCCDVDEQIARISFLLKSLQVIPDESNLAVQNTLGPLLSDLSEIQGATTAAELLSIFQAQPPEVQALINPEVIGLLATSPDPEYHANDILSASGGDFSVSGDPLVFIRPYLLNFPAAMELVDVVASFYAGFAPIDEVALESLLVNCAADSVGKEWLSEIESLPASDGKTCGDAFAELYQHFLEKRDGDDPRRLDDRIGSSLPALIHTTVLGGDGVNIWKKAVDAYNDAVVPVEFDVDFSDVTFGYFGDQKSLQRASVQLPKLFDDEKTNRFDPLGTETFEYILARSPAEPTLSKGVGLDDGRVSLGGWNDPVPAQVLTSIGCDKIVLINRPDGIGQFSIDVPTELGATDDIIEDLYALDVSTSSFATALATADATVCADWDSVESEPDPLAMTGYAAPFISTDACILSLDVEDITSEDANVGCTPYE